MATVGIIGGIGPESTIQYYRMIISSFLKKERNGNYPQIIINSINMNKMLELIEKNELANVTEFLLLEIERLLKAGADFALLASNTPHIVFNQISGLSPLPLLSIVSAARDEAVLKGYKQVGLFGTRFTMEGGFYDEVFAESGIKIIIPDEKDLKYIHAKYMDELVKGIIKDSTKQELLYISKRLKERNGADAIILGGTELPLILKESDDSEIPFIDTTMVHVKKIIEIIL